MNLNFLFLIKAMGKYGKMNYGMTIAIPPPPTIPGPRPKPASSLYPSKSKK